MPNYRTMSIHIKNGHKLYTYLKDIFLKVNNLYNTTNFFVRSQLLLVLGKPCIEIIGMSLVISRWDKIPVPLSHQIQILNCFLRPILWPTVQTMPEPRHGRWSSATCFLRYCQAEFRYPSGI